jgi:TP901 family phage tail tape measure protein
MGDTNLGRAVLELSTKDTGLTSGMNKAEATVKSKVDSMIAQFERLKTTMSTAATGGAAQVETSLGKVGSAGTKAATGLKQLETSAVSSAGAMKNHAAAAAQVEAKTASMAGQFEKSAVGVSGLGSGFAALASPMGMATTGMAGLGIAAIKSAGDFEASMAQLQVMSGISDKTSASFQQLKAAAIQVGEDTKFSSTEAADGMADLAAAGLKTQDVLAAIGPVAQAAMINNVGISDSAKVATVSMNAFGLQAKDMGNVIDVTTTAANLGVLKFQDFGQAMAAVGSVAKLANQGLTGITAELIALTNNGQSAADAGTSIKSVLLSLTNPSSEAADAMKTLGLNIYDAQGKMIPFSQIVKQVETNTKGMTDAQRNQLLATVAGSDGIRAFAGALNATITVQKDGKDVTLQGSAALEEYQKQLDNSGGAAQKAANIIESTFNAKLEQTKGKIDELIRKLGEDLLPFANQVLDQVDQKISDDSLNTQKWLNSTGHKDDLLTQIIGNIGGFGKEADAAKFSADALKRFQTAQVDASKATAQGSAALKIYVQDNIQTRKYLEESALAEQKVAQANKLAASSAEYYRQRLEDANAAIDYNALSFQHLSPPMQAVYDKANGLTGQISTLEIAIQGLNNANDALSSKMSAESQILQVVGMGVDQANLKYKDTTITLDGHKMTVAETFAAYQDLVKAQDAGGKGAYEAGVKAGQYADVLKSLDHGALAPLVDTTYNATHKNDEYAASMVKNTTDASEYQVQVDALAQKAGKLLDAFEQGAEKARGHANALNQTSSAASTTGTTFDKTTGQLEKYNETHPAIKTAVTNFAEVKELVGGAALKLGDWSKTNAAPKTPNTNFAQIERDIDAAIVKLATWNLRPALSKVLTITTNLITNGSPAPTGGGGSGGAGGGPGGSAPTPTGGGGGGQT